MCSNRKYDLSKIPYIPGQIEMYVIRIQITFKVHGNIDCSVYANINVSRNNRTVKRPIVNSCVHEGATWEE